MKEPIKADGVRYRNADGDLKRETPYDIPLRDVTALFALIANELRLMSDNQPPSSPESMAEGAYMVADAMLKTRDQA